MLKITITLPGDPHLLQSLNFHQYLNAAFVCVEFLCTTVYGNFFFFPALKTCLYKQSNSKQCLTVIEYNQNSFSFSIVQYKSSCTSVNGFVDVIFYIK